jgi:hypothetical protein
MSETVNYPLINGVYPSWASVEIRVQNYVIGGITEINYKPSLESNYVLGAGAQPIGQTEGMTKYEGDFTILLPQWHALQKLLGDGYGRVPLDIIVTYSPVGNDDSFDTVQDSMIGARIQDVGATMQASSGDALVKKIALKPMRIYEGASADQSGLNIYGQEVNPDI